LMLCMLAELLQQSEEASSQGLSRPLCILKQVRHCCSEVARRHCACMNERLQRKVLPIAAPALIRTVPKVLYTQHGMLSGVLIFVELFLAVFLSVSAGLGCRMSSSVSSWWPSRS
jgi:hypothetical protein